MTDDFGAVSMLDAHECLALLRSADVGRLAFLTGERPDVLPVNFVVDHGAVVFRTGAGSKLAAATAGQPVAFEVDGYDAEAGTAWSVVVKGHALAMRSMYDLFEAAMLPLFPWHAAPKHHFVRIAAEEMSGRRFTVVRDDPGDPRARPRAAHE